jgi:uncharacterized protein (TIGR01777 family)
MARVVIAGGNGLIGRKLTERLQQAGHNVTWLVRAGVVAPPGVKVARWEIESDSTELVRDVASVDHAVYLAGYSLANGRLGEEHKRMCWTSRVDGARLFRKALAGTELKSFVGGSAIGYYGWAPNNAGKVFREDDPPGADWSSTLVREWEKEYGGYNCRTAIIRTAVVLSRDGGALPKLLTPAQLGLSAALGLGLQIFPWVHETDIVSMFEQALFDPAWSGPVNGVAPDQPTNQHFTEALAKAVSRPYVLPNVPETVVRLLFGGVADLLLNGNFVANQRLQELGFRYEFSSLDKALPDLVGKQQ